MAPVQVKLCTVQMYPVVGLSYAGTKIGRRSKYFSLSISSSVSVIPAEVVALEVLSVRSRLAEYFLLGCCDLPKRAKKSLHFAMYLVFNNSLSVVE